MKIKLKLEFIYQIGKHNPNHPIDIVPVGATAITSLSPSPTGEYPVGTDVTIPLKYFFFRYSSGSSGEAEGITGAAGDFEIDVTSGSSVNMEIFAHNAAVRVGKYPGIAFPVSTLISFTAVATAQPAVTLSGLSPEVETAFITAVLLQDSYQNGLKEFASWRLPIAVSQKISNNDFPVGYETTRQDNNQIDVLIPGLVVQLPYNNPNPGGNPTIHYGEIPAEFAHEFGHALQFIKSRPPQREKIFNEYLKFLTFGVDFRQDILDRFNPSSTFSDSIERRAHWFNKRTLPFVAFLEAFAMFAGTFYGTMRLMAPPLSMPKPPGINPPDALHPEHHRIFYHLYRRNGPTSGGTEYPTTGTSNPILKSWPAAPLEEVEGAIFSALYIDYAGRDPIGLDFVVTAYIQSEATTLQEYVNWIRDRYGLYSPQYIELHDVMTTWGMLSSSGVPAPGKFLRAPVSEQMLSALPDLDISEIPMRSNPRYGDAPSGGLELIWDSGSNQPVEISPMFGGWVRFIADSDDIRPKGLIDAQMTGPGDWTLTGRLVITGIGGHLKRDFLAQLPGSLVPNPPDLIIYEPIRLTPEFFSETLAGATLVQYSEGTSPPPPAGNILFSRLVYEFINGRALMQWAVDTGTRLRVVTDANKTIVRSGLSKQYLWVTMLIRSPLVLDTAGFWWMIPKTNDYEGLAGSAPGTPKPIIDPSFTGLPPAKALNIQTYDPLHPNQTVIPLWMILNEVGDSVLIDDPATHPILTAIKTGNRKYRRIELKRWGSAKGRTIKQLYERQYPFFQIMVTQLSDSSTMAAKVPASGVVYLPLGTGLHTFRVAPRWESPPNIISSIRISLDSGGPVIPHGNTSVNVEIMPGADVVELYVSNMEYDGSIAWDHLKSEVSTGDYQAYKQQWVTRFGVRADDVPDAFLPVSFSGVIADYYRSHRLMYGLALQSAGRHHLPTELVLAVMFAAGLDKKFSATVNAPVAYVPDDLIQGPEIGLYNIGDTYSSLVNAGYVDHVRVPVSVLENQRTISTGLEAGSNTADIRGWEAAIELVAATLHAGLDFLTIEYHNPPGGLAAGPCGSNSTKFHTTIPGLDGDAPLIFAIFSCLPKPSSISEGYSAHFLGCFADKKSAGAKMAALKWDVKDSAGALRYPTGPDDSSFLDYENIRYQILRRLAMTLALKDCGGFA